MLRLAADDPLAASLFTPKELAGVRKLSRVKRGRRAGALTTEQEIELGLEQRGFIGFSRQYKFALEIGRHWAFDFAFVSHKLAIEFEGLVMRKGLDGCWQVGGRHATISGMRGDMEKYNCAAMMHWCVLRYERGMVNQGILYRDVENFLVARGAMCRSSSTHTTQDL